MSTYIFVHGAFSGAWCWKKVTALMENAGHNVIAVDLPGHGSDRTPPSQITMEHYTRHLIQIIQNEPAKVILVGHSFGGLVISQTAELIPNKIESLVYVAALLPENGQTFMGLNEKNSDALPLPLTVVQDMGYMKIDVNGIRDNFYGETSEEDYLFAQKMHGEEPLIPFVTPVTLTEQKFGRIKRYYIETLKDKSISPGFQREMVRQVPCERTFSLDTDHSPFFSQPEKLTEILKRFSE